jgi:tripartite-type tricarboxylate transporter receptor subunit TctC
MKLSRRRFLHTVAGAAALPALAPTAIAQTYPSRPVRLILGFPPAGSVDITARLTAQWLSERLGQSFIVENRPGAGGNLATELVVRAPPDGYTLLVAVPGNAINATLYDKLNYNFITDIAPVAGVIRAPFLMEVNPQVPAVTVPEFIAYAKANPGKINFASAGVGTSPHVTGELFKMMTGVDMVHVPYRGNGPALNDLIGGQVQLLFDSIPSSVGHVRSGRTRALAVTSPTRWDALPDIPAVAESVPGFDTSLWIGLGAPRNTPPEIVGALNQAVNAALADPAIKAKLTELGGVALPGSPAVFAKFLTDETEKWRTVVRAANIKAE